MGKSTVRGERIAVSFDSDRCIHARFCVLGNPKVFVPGADGQWIFPDEADANEIEAIIRRCPSGALAFERLDGQADERPPIVNIVQMHENGPLSLHADTRMDDGSHRLRTVLCRCGHSKEKPYCDGSHHDSHFSASGEREAKDAKPLAARGGELRVRPQKDGPLKLEGPVELVSGTNRTLDRMQSVSLCRCGHSGNKPYCDGSHAKVGFQADGE